MDSTALPLIKQASKAFEAYAVSTYKIYRNRKDGTVQTVTVEVLDAGSDGENRYHVYATSDDGKAATGNPAESLQVALAIVHWGNLG